MYLHLISVHTLDRLLANFDLLRRRYRIQRDSHDDLHQKLSRSELTKNYLDMELNNLKPNLKRLQAEKGTILRWVCHYVGGMRGGCVTSGWYEGWVSL